MEHTVLLAENPRYKVNMGQISQKKSEQVLVMLVPEMFEHLKLIAAAEDRPLGYVARELMVRGLALYQVDGVLKGEPVTAKSKVAATIGPATIEEVRRMQKKNAELLEGTPFKARKVKHLGEVTDKHAEKKRKAS